MNRELIKNVNRENSRQFLYFVSSAPVMPEVLNRASIFLGHMDSRLRGNDGDYLVMTKNFTIHGSLFTFFKEER